MGGWISHAAFGLQLLNTFYLSDGYCMLEGETTKITQHGRLQGKKEASRAITNHYVGRRHNPMKYGDMYLFLSVEFPQNHSASPMP